MRLLHDASEDVLAIVEVLVKLAGGFEHLSSRVDQLSQVGPGVVEGVLPLGDRGGVGVAGADQAVGDLVDCGDAL